MLSYILRVFFSTVPSWDRRDLVFRLLYITPGDPARDRRRQASPPTLSGFAKASASTGLFWCSRDLALG